MWEKLKNIFRSIFFDKDSLKKGMIFYGSATEFLERDFNRGSLKWRNKHYSFKLVVDRVDETRVYYYSFYIDPEGEDYIQNQVKYIDKQTLIQSIKKLKLIIG